MNKLHHLINLRVIRVAHHSHGGDGGYVDDGAFGRDQVRHGEVREHNRAFEVRGQHRIENRETPARHARRRAGHRAVRSGGERVHRARARVVDLCDQRHQISTIQ